MDYRKRMTRALAAAFTVHVAAVMAPTGCPHNVHGIGSAAVPQPLVVTLRRPDTPMRLIETGAPADTPVNPATDLIAEQDSKAQDMSEAEGRRAAPFVPTAAAWDEPREARGPRPTPAPQLGSNPSAPNAETAVKPEETTDSPRLAEGAGTLEAVQHPLREPAEPDSEPERFQVAKADPTSPPAPEVGQTRGRVEGGVKSVGFLSFEAMRSEFAPYLREVRNRVEKRWKALIHLRYSGASTTRAVVDCAIASDGALAYVTIVEAGDSASYAGLCKEAIERAGPFPPFPFRVPEVYRNQNLEIRWTFSFL